MFAPTNDAFGKIPPKTSTRVLADKADADQDPDLPRRRRAAQPRARLAGTHKTLEPATR